MHFAGSAVGSEVVEMIQGGIKAGLEIFVGIGVVLEPSGPWGYVECHGQIAVRFEPVEDARAVTNRVERLAVVRNLEPAGVTDHPCKIAVTLGDDASLVLLERLPSRIEHMAHPD